MKISNFWNQWHDKLIGNYKLSMYANKNPFKGNWVHWQLGILFTYSPAQASNVPTKWELQIALIWFRFYVSRFNNP